MAELSALQKFIDTNINDVTGNCYSFVCSGITGDCIIPEDVCIRFIKTAGITGAQAEGNNVLNFDDCTLLPSATSYTFKNSVINLNKCEIKDKMVFENCKVYLTDCSGTGELVLKNSYCKSNKNIFSTSGDTKRAFSISVNSKVESYNDTFYNFDGPVFSLSDHSFIKISDPKISAVGEVILADNYSKFELYNLTSFIGREGSRFATITNNSTLKIHCVKTPKPTFNINSSAIYLDTSSCYFNGLGNTVIKGSFITAVNSLIEINQTDSLVNSGTPYIFDCVDSIINIYAMDTLSASGSGCFKLDNSQLVYINSNTASTISAYNGSVIQGNSKGKAVINKTKFYLDTIGTIKSSAIAFDINGSSLSLTNIDRLVSTSSVVASNTLSSTVDSKVILSNINNIESNGGAIVFGANTTKIFASNIGHASSYASCFSSYKGSLFVQYITTLSSSNGNCIEATNSSCSIFDIETSSSSKSAFSISNLSATTVPVSFINNCLNVKGDIVLEYATVKVSNLRNINGNLIINTAIVDLNNVTVNNTFSAMSSVVTNTNCNFNGIFNVQDSVVYNTNSPLQEITNARNSSIINSLSPTKQNINVYSSSLLNLTSSVTGSIDITGSSTLLALNSTGDVITTDEGTFTDLNAALIVGAGRLGIAANNSRIDIRALELEEKLRATVSITADSKYTLTVGTSVITIDRSKINLAATNVHSEKVG
jgi:hypothetical protein